MSTTIPIVYLQGLDSICLIGCALSSVAILQRDYKDAPLIARAALASYGTLSFAQAMWLLGIWQPGASGYAWPRVMLDASLFSLCLIRLFAPMTIAKINVRIEKSAIRAAEMSGAGR